MGFEHEEENCFPGCGHMEDDSNYCIHGKFVGNWAGPDYMCFYCEMGVTLEEYRETVRLRRVRESIKKKGNLVFRTLVKRLNAKEISEEYAIKHINRLVLRGWR